MEQDEQRPAFRLAGRKEHRLLEGAPDETALDGEVLVGCATAAGER
jgi:hypothetical protein